MAPPRDAPCLSDTIGPSMEMPATNLTKHSPPLCVPGMVPRRTLLATLSGEQRPRLTVLLAPAGYGKTTLMVQWMAQLRQQGESVSWLGLDEFDNDPARLNGYLLAALPSPIDPSFASAGGEAAASQAGQEGDRLGWHSDIPLDGPAHVLFIDEFEKLTAEPALKAMKLFLQSVPARIRIVLASREKPAIGLDRLRAQGELLELTSRELSFDIEETRRFFSGLSGRTTAHPQPWVIDRLQKVTHGWPAGLQLSALAARSPEDLARYARDLPGSQASVADFLAEEVLQAQPADLRQFLLETCAFPRLNEVACNAATGRTDSQRFLQALHRHGLFTSALDTDEHWFRYHPIFADFLKVQQARDVPSEHARAIHRSAARWFARHGTDVEAVDLWLLAGDIDAAMQEMAGCARTLIILGQFGTMLRWIERLPNVPLESLPPRLLQGGSWAFCFSGRPETALTWAQVLKDMPEAKLEADAPGLTTKLAALEAVMLAMSGNAVVALNMAMAQWPSAGHEDLFATGALANVISYGLMLRGEHARAQSFSDQARACNERIGSALGLGYALSVSSMIEASQGRLAQALDLFGEVSTATRRYLTQHWCDSSHVNIASLGIASSVLYEMDAKDQATELLQQYLPMVMHQPSVDMLLLSGIVHARLHVARGEVEAGLRILEDIDQCFPQRFAFARAHRVVQWERFRIELTTGGPAKALARKAVLDHLLEPESPDEASHSIVEELYGHGLEAIRYDMALGRLEAARLRVGQEIAKAIRMHRVWRLLKLHILDALVCDAQGKSEACQQTLRRALALSHGMNALRSFLDEGPRMHELLKALALQTPSAGPHEPWHDHLARLTVQAMAPAPFVADAGAEARHAAPTDHPPRVSDVELSDREKVILRLLGEGKANEDIAQAIYLSVHTVKWYVRRILEKLKVRNRSEAVFVARQRGLLD
jgi:LuxR family maltose regulon positive regulatory protein